MLRTGSGCWRSTTSSSARGRTSRRATRLRFERAAGAQSSSGVLVSTGAGSQRVAVLGLHPGAGAHGQDGRRAGQPWSLEWEDPRLAFVVREPFISRHSGADAGAAASCARSRSWSWSRGCRSGASSSATAWRRTSWPSTRAPPRDPPAAQRARLVVGDAGLTERHGRLDRRAPHRQGLEPSRGRGDLRLRPWRRPSAGPGTRSGSAPAAQSGRPARPRTSASTEAPGRWRRSRPPRVAPLHHRPLVGPRRRRVTWRWLPSSPSSGVCQSSTYSGCAVRLRQPEAHLHRLARAHARGHAQRALQRHRQAAASLPPLRLLRGLRLLGAAARAQPAPPHQAAAARPSHASTCHGIEALAEKKNGSVAAPVSSVTSRRSLLQGRRVLGEVLVVVGVVQRLGRVGDGQRLAPLWP